jgi:hypothetical protein
MALPAKGLADHDLRLPRARSRCGTTNAWPGHVLDLPWAVLAMGRLFIFWPALAMSFAGACLAWAWAGRDQKWPCSALAMALAGHGLGWL